MHRDRIRNVAFNLAVTAVPKLRSLQRVESMPLLKDLRFEHREVTYGLDLPGSQSQQPSVLAFSIWKAGSTLLYQMLKAMCAAAGLTYFSPDDTLFGKGLLYRPSNIGHAFLEAGYCYGGFRIFPYYPIPILDTAKTVLLVRDPRDALVSLYFSIRDSHILPPADTELAEKMILHREQTKAQSINQWALENHGMIMAAFEGYLVNGFARRENVRTYRYEDIIFRKREWAADIGEWYGWDLGTDIIEQIIAPLDVLPEEERPREHIRQVRPGNFRRHLSPETQSKVADIFHQYLETLGYSR